TRQATPAPPRLTSSRSPTPFRSRRKVSTPRSAGSSTTFRRRKLPGLGFAPLAGMRFVVAATRTEGEVAAARRFFRIVLDAFHSFNAHDGWALASPIALTVLMALFPFLVLVVSRAARSLGP